MIGSHFIQDIEQRVAGKPENLQAAVRRTLADIDPNLTVLDMMSLSEQLDRNFNQDRLIARLTELFGLLALVLACVGLYGVTAYSVAPRTGEIGIRMALGAGARSVIWIVVRGAMFLVAIGLAAGVPAALGLSRYLQSLLFGLKPMDAVSIVVVILVMTLMALTAVLFPARRAFSVNPVTALRNE